MLELGLFKNKKYDFTTINAVYSKERKALELQLININNDILRKKYQNKINECEAHFAKELKKIELEIQEPNHKAAYYIKKSNNNIK